MLHETDNMFIRLFVLAIVRESIAPNSASKVNSRAFEIEWKTR